MGHVDCSAPKGWSWKKFKDVCVLKRGYDLPTHVRSAGNYPLYSANGVTDYIDQYKVCGPGVVTGRSGTIGKVHFVEGDYWPLNTALYVQKFNENYPRFIKYFLESFDLTRFVSGAAVPTLNRNSLSAELVCTPDSVNEQRRIVEKLDALFTSIDAAVEHLEDNIILADALLSSALLRVFNPSGSKVNLNGDFKLPEDWNWMTVKKLSKKIQYGHTAKAAVKGNAQFLRITDIQDNNIDWSDVPFVNLSDKEIEKYVLCENDLVFARSGATAGKSILIKEPPENAVFASYLIRISPDVDLINPEYLGLFFKSPAYWEIVKTNAAGAAQPNINGTKLGQFKVPTPKLKIQESIVDEISSLSAHITDLKKDIRSKISFLNLAKSSILNSAFKGEL